MNLLYINPVILLKYAQYTRLAGPVYHFPFQSFLRNDIMSTPEFKAIPARPRVKCGATERSGKGDCMACDRARSSAYYAANRDKQRALKAAHYAANRDRIKAAASAYYAANKEKAKATTAAWRLANPEKIRAASEAWKAANQEKAKGCIAEWKAAHPEALLMYNQNRRALKKGAGGKLSKGLFAKLFKLQKGKCPCCKQPLGEDYHLDHIQPLALGGSNTDDNMQLLRAKCNLQKNAKHPIDFMQHRGFLL